MSSKPRSIILDFLKGLLIAVLPLKSSDILLKSFLALQAVIWRCSYVGEYQVSKFPRL